MLWKICSISSKEVYFTPLYICQETIQSTLSSLSRQPNTNTSATTPITSIPILYLIITVTRFPLLQPFGSPYFGWGADGFRFHFSCKNTHYFWIGKILFHFHLAQSPKQFILLYCCSVTLKKTYNRCPSGKVWVGSSFCLPFTYFSFTFCLPNLNKR